MRDRKTLGLRPWPAPPADLADANFLAEIARNCEVWKCDALVISGRFCQRHEQELKLLHRMAEAADTRDAAAMRKTRRSSWIAAARRHAWVLRLIFVLGGIAYLAMQVWGATSEWLAVR